MAERKGLSKKVRFEVFKRDSFTCQYCGKSAPGVILEVDHIKPVSRDGDNEITNLITACQDCNAGKSNRELSDDTVVAKRKAQLDELQERREQIEMMMEWQGTLADISDVELMNAVSFINSFMRPYTLNDSGVDRVKKSLSKYGLSEILESTRISSNQYLPASGEISNDNANTFVDYVHRIAKNRKLFNQKPYLKDLYHIRNYLKNRNFYIGYDFMRILESAYIRTKDVDSLWDIAFQSSNWTDWNRRMESFTDGK